MVNILNGRQHEREERRRKEGKASGTMNRGALLGECEEGTKASDDQCAVRHEEQAKHPTPHEFLPFLEEAWLRNRAVHVAKVREASVEEAGGGARSKCL
jgi:hypothetical protein